MTPARAFMTGFLRGLADPALLRLVIVASLLLWAQPSIPLVLLVLYFFVQHEALVIRANREQQRVDRLIASWEDGEKEKATDEDERCFVQELEDEALGYALFQRWPEQRH